MPIPPFIADLRSRLGQEQLWLTGTTAVVLDDAGRVLLTQRSDDGRWALPSGIVEPGEHLARTCAREVAEETGVVVEVQRLLSLSTLPPMAYPNGDRCQFVDHTFACRAVGGEARVADDESLQVAWVEVAALPALPHRQREDVEGALTGAETWFQR